MSWINDLDALASAGVIPFDAPAYIRGVPPRYVGNPPLEGISDQLPQMKQQPKKDEFLNDSTAIHNPRWKKLLFGATVLGALAFGGYKLKNKVIPFVKKLFKGKKVKLPLDVKTPFAPKNVKVNPKKLKYAP